jgi:hypothetical protein
MKLNSSQNEKFFRINIVEKTRRRLFFSVTFSEGRSICEIMWTQMTIRYGACALHAE